MANKKISELPTATTPLAGTEEFEIVQGGINKRVAASDVGGGGGTWGSITGTLLDQTDLAAYLRRVRSVTGTDSVVQADDNALIIFNSASPFNFTLDQLTSNIGSNQSTKFGFINIGSAAVTFTNGSGVTASGNLVISGAVGNNYPSGIVYYDTTTTPRVVSSDAVEAGYWRTVPGTPTRVGNTSFTVTDTSNANLYNLVLSKGTVLKWTDTTTKMAMVSSATYSSDAVTVNLIGDVLSGTATMSSMEYAIEKCKPVVMAVAGTLATGTDLFGKYFGSGALKPFGGQAFHGTAGTTNATTYDVNKNGTTIFTTKLSVASGATVGTITTADDGATMADTDVLTGDCDSVSTTAPVDAYLHLFLFPLNNQYL